MLFSCTASQFLQTIAVVPSLSSVGSSSTFYSAYEISKLNEYLDKQDLDHGYYYTLENPVLWQSAQEDEL